MCIDTFPIRYMFQTSVRSILKIICINFLVTIACMTIKTKIYIKFYLLLTSFDRADALPINQMSTLQQVKRIRRCTSRRPVSHHFSITPFKVGLKYRHFAINNYSVLRPYYSRQISTRRRQV